VEIPKIDKTGREGGFFGAGSPLIGQFPVTVRLTVLLAPFSLAMLT
jgi:hypothetical protein